MPGPEKKKGRSVSLTDAELSRFEAQARAHGFPNKNEYLLALLDMDARGEVAAVWGQEHGLRLESASAHDHVAEEAAAYGRTRLSRADIEAIAKRTAELTRHPSEHPPDARESKRPPPAPPLSQAI